MKKLVIRLIVSGAALALVLGAAAPAAAGLDVTRWRSARRVNEPFSGWALVTLDGLVLQGARPDLGDLRVVDAEKRELPWREVTGQAPWSPPDGPGWVAGAEPGAYRVRLFNLFSDPTAGRTTFVADLGEDAAVTNAVTLTTTSRDFFKRLTFAVSADLKVWRGLEGEDYVYDLTAKGGGRCLTVTYPDTSYRYLRVTVEDLGTPPLASLGAEVRYERVPAELLPVPSEVVVQGLTGDDSWTILDLGCTGLTVAKLRVRASGALARRPVALEGSSDGEKWTEVLWGVMHEEPGDAQPDEGWVGIDVPRTTYRFYRFTVVSGGDPPVTPESFVVLAVPRRIIFHSETGRPLFLLYGNPRAARPDYERAFFAGLGPETTFTPVTLGRELAVMTEPEEVTPPTKSDVDPRAWRFERPLTPVTEDGGWVSPGGFVQATVPLDVLDGARPDLGDLRVVDTAGLDTPVRVFTDRSALAETWPFGVVSAGTDKEGSARRSWWVLDLGGRNIPTQFLRVAVPARADNFRREVAVFGSNGGAAWDFVAAGEIHRIQTIFGPEESLAVAFPVTRYRYLRVSVTDAPAGLAPAEVKGFPPSMLFKWEPGGEYRLFWGNPAATARVYPAAGFLSASTFTAVRLGQGAFGPVTDHSPPPSPPSFLRPGVTPPVTGPANRWVSYTLWGLLAVVVVGTGLLVVRVFRALAERERGTDTRGQDPDQPS